MTCPSCGSEAEGVVCNACGKVLHESGRLPDGYRIADRYEIRRFLGEGGMGTVYEAYDRKLEERIALKLLKADFIHSQEMERRFRHEIKLARRLRHPNVCAIHEYGESGPLRYIALELIEGIDLKRRLREIGVLGSAEGFRVALQITQGLDCIHKAGVVHRDLKTSNVMLDRNGDVRLMDFGIAKQLGVEATLGATAVGSIIGTPEYMSPEQGRGETIDCRSDLYSLGIVIYEIFTGDVPFRGDTPIATIFKTIQEPVDLDGPRAKGIPVSLRPVLLRALAKSASDRFASADEMVTALTVARDATLGAGATAPFPDTRVEHPTATVAGLTMRTPAPVPTASAPTWITPPPIPPDVATRLTPPTVGEMQWRPPAVAPRPAGAGRGAFPFLVSALGLALLLGTGLAFVHFWPQWVDPASAGRVQHAATARHIDHDPATERAGPAERPAPAFADAGFLAEGPANAGGDGERPPDGEPARGRHRRRRRRRSRASHRHRVRLPRPLPPNRGSCSST